MTKQRSFVNPLGLMTREPHLTSLRNEPLLCKQIYRSIVWEWSENVRTKHKLNPSLDEVTTWTVSPNITFQIKGFSIILNNDEWIRAQHSHSARGVQPESMRDWHLFKELTFFFLTLSLTNKSDFDLKSIHRTVLLLSLEQNVSVSVSGRCVYLMVGMLTECLIE